jgi:hypothetical protein
MTAPEDKTTAAEKPEDTPTETGGDPSKGWHDAVIAVVVLLCPALIGLILFAIPSAREGIGMAVLTAAASFGVGSLFGFIFGIPRTLSSPHEDGVALGTDGRRPVAANTNLEQISDWLTKILVGVGLVQLAQIRTGIGDLANGLAPSLGGGNTGYPVAIALMISFTIVGFIGSYLFTRLRLEGAFSLAAVTQHVNQKAEEVDKKVEEAKEKAEEAGEAVKELDQSTVANGQALALVTNQLDPQGSQPTLEELEAALKAASPGTREKAFYLARDQRRANWRDGEKSLVDLTIPVFEALITLDDDRRFHRNYAELGYALKDRAYPTPADYELAREKLSIAIDIRGPQGASGFSMYEFNRAFCKIKLDPALPKGEASSDELAAEICADLEIAATTENGRWAIHGSTRNRDQEAIGIWLKLNRGSALVGERVEALLKIAGIA